MITPANLVNIDRALHELKCGRSITIRHDTHGTLTFCAAEAATETDFELLKQTNTHLVLSNHRSSFISSNATSKLSSITLQPLDYDALSLILWKNISDESYDVQTTTTNYLYLLALNLCIAAELIPAIIIDTRPKQNYTPLTLSNDDILTFSEHYQNDSGDVIELCRAPLVLASSPINTIIAFRESGMNKEHYAIIIGSPKNVPLVRLHSSCFTGDLLASLSCDCKDQLHTAIDHMSQKDGGIILYLTQEGRNIGLVNKLRAYHLKAQGLDTVDANLAIGFDEDHRNFNCAAGMLKHLDYHTINLLTNNPKKAKDLSQHGIIVETCVPHQMHVHEHNKDYLKTKKDRLGHNFT